jgi:hypothetical protein
MKMGPKVFRPMARCRAAQYCFFIRGYNDIP